MQHNLEIKCDGKLISSLTLCILDLRSRKAAIIEEVKTTEGYRNRGYGKLIMDLAIAKAVELQCDTIELCTNPKDALAQKLYQKTGFTEDGNIRMKKILNSKWESVGKW